MLSVIPNDPLFSDQWDSHNTGQTGGTWDADIDAPAAWSIATGDTSMVVAVLDTGIDYTHEDLYLNIWLNQGEIPVAFASGLTDTDGDGLITYRDLNDPTNAGYVSDRNGTGYIDAGDLINDPVWADGTDTDGNGYVDDISGYDFMSDVNDPMDDNGHGTIAAGVLGAVGDNATGIAGVCWNVQLMPLRFHDGYGNGSQNEAVEAIDYAVANGAKVSNNSWGVPGWPSGAGYSEAVRTAVANAAAVGHIVVAAAGNGGADWFGDNNDNPDDAAYPASYDLDNIIAVAATDHNDELGAFSNYSATKVDLGAPGMNIWSTVPTTPGRFSDPSGYWLGLTATSWATPHVTGIVALLQSQHPDWTYTQVVDRILATVDPSPSLQGKTVTGGRLNAAAALATTSIHVSDPSIIEGDTASTQLVFTVERRGDTTETIVLDWATSDGTASEGEDYEGATGQIVFDSLIENEKTISIIVNGDTTVEPHETFYVSLTLVGGSATLADSQALGTILNDDATISNDNATAVEGERSATFLDVFAPPPGSPPLIAPHDIEFGRDGNIYVSQWGGGVLCYDATTGAFVDTFIAPSSDIYGSLGMAFGPDGNLYLASLLRDRVMAFDGSDGSFLREFVARGYGGLDGPRGLVFGPDGNLYVTSSSTSSILCYDGTTGDFLGEFVTARSGGLNNPSGVTFGADGHLYVSGIGSKNILRYDGATGAFIDVFADGGNLDAPRNLLFGSEGDLYVSSWNDGRVIRYDGATGQFMGDLVPSGSGGLVRPWGLFFDSNDDLFVVSVGTGQVLRYFTQPHAAFTVTLSYPSAVLVTVDYTTTNGTAAAGSDYEATSGTLTFTPGETSKTIIVPTLNDEIAEDNETFFVNLSNPSSNATIVDGQGVAMIVDDDPPIPGDFDSDFDVDGDDFLTWQVGFGTQSGANLEDGDANGDGDVDGDDFLVWQANFGTGGGGAGAAAAESRAAPATDGYHTREHAGGPLRRVRAMDRTLTAMTDRSLKPKWSVLGDDLADQLAIEWTSMRHKDVRLVR